jgi:hypothetical protein
MNNIAVSTLVHDGCNCPKVDNPEKLCKELKEHIWDTLGLNVNFTNKSTSISKDDEEYYKKNMVFYDEDTVVDCDTYDSVKEELENEGGLSMIQNPQIYTLKIGNNIEFYKKCELMNLIVKKVLVWDAEHQIYLKRKFIDLWLDDEYKRTYSAVDFKPPPLKCPKGVLNMYFEKKFSWEDGIINDENMEKAKLLFDHIHLCAEKNTEQRDFVIKYIMHMLKYGGNLPRIALIFKSIEEGSGKGSLMKLIKALLQRGDNADNDLFVQTASFVRDCISTGGIQHRGKLCVVADECSYKDTKGEIDDIKNFITEPQRTFRELYKGSITMQHCSRLIITTNNSTPIPFSNDSRRFVVMEIPDDKVGDFDYFDKFNEYIEDVNIVRCLVKLMEENVGDCDLLKYSFEKNRPKNDAFKNKMVG